MGKIKVYCYNEWEEFDNIEDAKIKYLNAIYSSEGSEQERYKRIYNQLKQGKHIVSDEVKKTPKKKGIPRDVAQNHFQSSVSMGIMKKAKIFYYTNKLPHPSTNKIWGKIYNEIHFNSDTKPVSIPIGFFKRYWRVLPIQENITSTSDIEEIFTKYNINNPYANPEGQRIIKEYNTHTSMSVGDIIKVGSRYYIIAGEGFKKVVLR